MDYQDVLAVVGAGSAHPGGMNSTLQWIDKIKVAPEWRVLEVGCGTGRTLSHIAAKYQCSCTGVDLRAPMVQKALTRSRQNNLNIHWQVADATHLPFPNNTFDFVYSESVNVFVKDMPKAMSEYLRVLKPGGQYLDVEMTLMAPVDREWKQEVKKVYGAQTVPDIRGWKRAFGQAGFQPVTVLHSQAINPTDMMDAETAHPDSIDLATPGAYQNPHVMNVLEENSNWLENNYRSMGFVVIGAHKPTAE